MGYSHHITGTAPTPPSYGPPCCYHGSSESLWVARMLATQSVPGFFYMLFYPTFLPMSFCSCLLNHDLLCTSCNRLAEHLTMSLHILKDQKSTAKWRIADSLFQSNPMLAHRSTFFTVMLSLLLVAVHQLHLLTLHSDHSVRLHNIVWDVLQKSKKTHHQMVL